MSEEQRPDNGENRNTEPGSGTGNAENKKRRGLRKADRKREKRQQSRKSVLGWRLFALLLFVLIVFSLAGILGGAWIWFEGSPQSRQLQQQVRQMQRRSGHLQERIDRLTQQHSGLSGRLRHQSNDLNALDQKMGSIQKGLGKLNDLVQGGHQVWQLDEVEELLLMANDRLALRQDIPGALQAFRIAQRRLGRIADPRLTPVRKQLADQITALESLPDLDVEGMALRLSSLAARVKKLPLAPNVPKNYRENQQTSRQTGKHWWQRLGGSIADTLKGVVRIRRTDKPPYPLLAPSQEFFLYQNLGLKLESARLALLARHNKAFHDSLHSVQNWLTTYFDTDDSGVRAMQQALQHMQGKNLQPALPHMGQALGILRKELRRRGGAHHQMLQPTGSADHKGADGS